MSEDRFPRGRTAIVGTGTWGMGEAPGLSSLEIAAQASLAALADAGLAPSDLDGVFGCLPDDMFAGLSISEYLGISPRITDNNRVGGSSFQTHAILAAMAIEAGQCDVALIAYASNQRSASGKLVSASTPFLYETRYRPLTPISAYALAASRHMHQFGTTREQLAEVAVSARKWAQLNPDAFMRDDLSIEDVLGARQVSSPLGVRDCCLVTDGGAAVVMVSAERARDLRQKPVYLLGGAAETTHRWISQMPDLTVSGTAEAARRAYAQAGVSAADVDVVELYDAFTINTILMLEDLGFCPKGEGGRFVADGAIAPGGRLPVNTNGGGLSCVHPGMYGLFTMVEATRQLNGTAGRRQVAGAELAVSHGNGGVLSSQALLVLGTAAAL
ncbi:thiolase [Pararhodobacter marinus]|uniref:Thiolase n=1 Tax=Pararhodobacter marinus TaxID=2184063 RepID=A0A2U2CI84_9RHOB|nr:thiolase [Pararhodobacter marinus]PWE31484.1 thiolase [Pararhodobacter marinus]